MIANVIHVLAEIVSYYVSWFLLDKFLEEYKDLKNSRWFTVLLIIILAISMGIIYKLSD
jgi:hypothetical protein